MMIADMPQKLTTVDNVTVRLVTEADLDAISNLFYRSYGDSYPYKEFYDDEWLKRSVYSDSYLFLLAELDGEVVGTASVYYEVGAYADLCGEFGRLVVEPGTRGKGVGSALMLARLAFAEKRLHFGLAECRTAHPYAQLISEKHGLRPIGFLPLKVLLDKRESLVLMGKAFGPAAKLRRNNPRVIPEVFLLGQLALQNLGFEVDLIAVEEVESYPIGTGFEVEELNEYDLFSLLRIERGRLSRRLVFGNLQLTYGLFQIQSRNSNYLVARHRGNIVGAIGFTHDPIGHSIKVVELIDLKDDVAGFLLKELDKRAYLNYNAKYIEITVSAYSPEIQRTLYNLGFLPVAYCPTFVFHKYERLDTVKMAKLYVPFDEDDIVLTEESEHLLALVRMGFREQDMGHVVNETTHHMPIFDGLEDWELQKIGSLCQLKTFKEGEIIMEAGKQSNIFYMIKEGSVDVYSADQGRLVGKLGQGDFIGEVALVSQRTHTATVVVTNDTELIALNHDEFENLIHRFPRIGLQVMRNIAIALGEKLKIVDNSGYELILS